MKPESFEGRHAQPETNFEALQETLNQLELHDDFDELDYRDHFYGIFYVDDEAFDGHAMWRVSDTGHYDIDVEVKLSLPENEKRRAILHEVIEADLTQYQKLLMKNAHEEASKLDQQYKSRDLPRENST